MSSALDRASRPAVTLKLATSLDGRIATSGGESKWITGPEARAQVHRLRAAHDAVLTGSGALLADDPELTARTDPRPARQPLRIIADSRGRTPANARVFATADQGKVAVATLRDTDVDAQGWPHHPNVHVWSLPADPATGSLSLDYLLVACAGSGVSTLMVESGGVLAAALLRHGVVDRLEWFRAPILLGSDARACVNPLGLAKLADAPTFVRSAVRECGRDLWETYERTD